MFLQNEKMNQLLQNLLDVAPDSYTSTPLHQLWIWSKPCSSFHLYHETLKLDAHRGQGVCLNNAFLRRHAPRCLLSVMSETELPALELTRRAKTSVDLQLDHLNADELVVLWDLFGRETPIVVPFTSCISSKCFESLVHYLDLTPFHLACYIHPLSPTVWFKPYTGAYGTFNFNRKYGTMRVVSEKDRVVSIFPISAPATTLTLEACTSIQLVELVWLVDPPTLSVQDIRLTAQSILDFQPSDYDKLMKLRFWQRTVPDLLQNHGHDQFIAQWAMRNWITIKNFARDDQLLHLHHNPQRLRLLMIQCCWRFDSLKAMCVKLNLRQVSLLEREMFWLHGATFCSLFHVSLSIEPFVREHNSKCFDDRLTSFSELLPVLLHLNVNLAARLAQCHFPSWSSFVCRVTAEMGGCFPTSSEHIQRSATGGCVRV